MSAEGSSQSARSSNITLRLTSEFSNLERVLDTAQQFATREELPADLQDRMLIALSEASTNAMRHGNRFDPLKLVIVEIRRKKDEIEITVADEGGGFNRQDVADPLLPENLLKTGGRGLFLIEELADDVNFEQGGSCLRMVFRDRQNET